MKLRIKGNSIRLRLAKAEVEQLCKQGSVEEQAKFGNTIFIYSLQKIDTGNIEANLCNNQLIVSIPSKLIEGWATNSTVGFDNKNANGEMPFLYILIEKDFKCIDNALEDQSDNYENPKAC